MEPERKIEKLLRAYAKKRRANAGDALKLHPATRRLLQDEVARNAAKPDEEEVDMSLWELFRRQWAFLVGFAVIVFFGATLFLPALSSAKKKSQSVTAMSNLRQIGLAAQIAAEENNGRLPATLDALTNQLVSETILSDTVSGKRFIYVAGGESLDVLPSNAVLAYSPTENKGRAVLFADGRVEIVKEKKFSELTNRGLSQLVAMKDSADQPPLAKAPAGSAGISGNVSGTATALAEQPKSEANRDETKLAVPGMVARNDIDRAATAPARSVATLGRQANEAVATDDFSSTQTNSVPFAAIAAQKLNFAAQNSFKNTVTQTKAAPVLANFQVQQYGDSIRVVDADGSIYDGTLQPENVGAQTTPAPAAAPPPIITANGQIEQAKAKALPAESQAAQNHSFRVAGFNQTLKQNVVFTGNLLANSGERGGSQKSPGINSGLVGGSGGGGGGQSQSAQANQLPWSNSRIAGTAVIADTNSIEINAEPLGP